MFKLDCRNWNQRHIQFAIFDPSGVNCGEIMILTSDVVSFVRDTWYGVVVWNNLIPSEWEVQVAK